MIGILVGWRFLKNSYQAAKALLDMTRFWVVRVKEI